MREPRSQRPRAFALPWARAKGRLRASLDDSAVHDQRAVGGPDLRRRPAESAERTRSSPTRNSATWFGAAEVSQHEALGLEEREDRCLLRW